VTAILSVRRSKPEYRKARPDVSGSSMPGRFQKFIWRVQDLANPMGVPIFLSLMVFLLLILNIIIAWRRWG
jgi:hypothetical protein